jgi:hypothetical protein
MLRAVDHYKRSAMHESHGTSGAGDETAGLSITAVPE